MAGIYLHIPFCKQACSYCDFYFSTHQEFKQDFLQAVYREIELRKDFIREPIHTIYFGGGTPSQLQVSEILGLLDQINQNFDISELEEVTLEANPDNLSEEYLSALAQSPVNRLSVGVQSFHDNDLIMLNRAHDGDQSYRAVQRAQSYGFKNLSIDLIYGLPGSTLESWQFNLDRAISLNVPHLSSYCLTVEPNTPLEYSIRKGRLVYPEESMVLAQFSALKSSLERAGYEHYEISNFALPDSYSQHNTSYWKGTHYLGLGPSAHSFNGKERYWNVADTRKYQRLLNSGKEYFEKELLSEQDHFNEYVMTHLRTQWGVSLVEAQQQFGETRYSDLLAQVQSWESQGHLFNEDGILKLTPSGQLLADQIAADLFQTD